MILEHGPSHTTDISQAKADLDKFGYCIIPEVLSDDEIETAKQRLLEQAEAEAGASEAELSDAEEMALDSFSEQNEEETVVATTNPLADAVSAAEDADLIQGEDPEEQYDESALEQHVEDAEQGEDETEAENEVDDFDDLDTTDDHMI